jgi:hypothetical protein
LGPLDLSPFRFPVYTESMIRTAFLAGLLALSAAVPALAAGDPAAVAAVEQFLRDDEKAMLAAVLSNPAAAADFNADVKFAAGDAKVMKLVLDKWRGRVVAYAETDAKIATPDLEGTYRNYGALMTAQTRAYLLRRLKTMKEGDRNSLIEYLDSVDSALTSNGGKLTWYTKKVVSGIFDKYRQDLSTYLPEPIARDGKTAAPAAAADLAARRKAAEPAPVLPPSVVTKDPPVVKDPVVPGKPPVVPGKKPASSDALEQARRAAEAAERSGGHFDGGGTTPPAGDGVYAGAPGAGRPPLAPTAKPGEKPSLIGDVPSPVDPDDSFMSDIKKMKTGPAPMKMHDYLPGGLGALLGGIIGFFLGGPIGALIGAGVGLIAGDIAGGKLFK